jgi:hypothetical protein
VQEPEIVMHLDTIAALLSKRVGFDAKIVGARKITRAVESRRAACGLADVDAYLKVLQASSQEFNWWNSLLFLKPGFSAIANLLIF